MGRLPLTSARMACSGAARITSASGMISFSWPRAETFETVVGERGNPSPPVLHSWDLRKQAWSVSWLHLREDLDSAFVCERQVLHRLSLRLQGRAQDLDQGLLPGHAGGFKCAKPPSGFSFPPHSLKDMGPIDCDSRGRPRRAGAAGTRGPAAWVAWGGDGTNLRVDPF